MITNFPLREQKDFETLILMADIEEQFDAAVSVIKGLPKGGKYQASRSTD